MNYGESYLDMFGRGCQWYACRACRRAYPQQSHSATTCPWCKAPRCDDSKQNDLHHRYDDPCLNDCRACRGFGIVGGYDRNTGLLDVETCSCQRGRFDPVDSCDLDTTCTE